MPGKFSILIGCDKAQTIQGLIHAAQEPYRCDRDRSEYRGLDLGCVGSGCRASRRLEYDLARNDQARHIPQKPSELLQVTFLLDRDCAERGIFLLISIAVSAGLPASDDTSQRARKLKSLSTA